MRSSCRQILGIVGMGVGPDMKCSYEDFMTAMECER